MIQPVLEGNPTAAEHWAFDQLLDLSRLLPVSDDGSGAVRASLADRLSEGDFAPEPGRLRLSRDLLRRVLEIGGAAAEQRTTERDRHGRVPSGLNPQVQTGAERTLPLHRWADALVEAVTRAAGNRPVFRLRPWPDGRGWAAAITHDLDIVSGWPLYAALRGTELLRKGELGRAISAMASSAGALASDPVGRSIGRILEIERAVSVRSTWFVLSGEPTLAGWRRGDITYRLEGAAARKVIARVMRDGHEIGLHGSFETRDDAGLMAEERARVERVTGKAPRGIRQHFLRLDPARTLLHAESAGFDYDATFGYADRNGFRLGAADVLGLWNEPGQRGLNLREAPLVWMDRTHSKYLGQEEPTVWMREALALAAVVREAGGLWVGLWHPNVSSPLGFPGALDTFEALVQGLAAQQPWMAPLEEIVAWRSARRSLRGRLHAGGTLELLTDTPGRWSLSISEINAGRDLSFGWPSHG